jgi:mono/diheme cytochrome c family protein
VEAGESRARTGDGRRDGLTFQLSSEVRFIVFKKAYIAGAATASAVADCLTMGAGALAPAPPPAFTAEQAAAGRVAYARNCASCHMPDLSGNGDIPQLSGEIFQSTWRKRSTKELVDYLSATMPPAGPRHGTETYLAISAYILHANGAVTGAQALDASTAVPLASLLPTGASTP